MIQNSGKRRRATALVAAVALGASLTACTGSDSPPRPIQSAATSWPADPLLDLRAIPDYAELVDTRPSLHHRAVGSTTFVIPTPPPEVVQQRFFVSCSPDSHVKVTMGGFYAGPCEEHFSNDGSIPMETTGRPLRVSVDVPDGVRFWIMSIPIEKNEVHK